MPSELDDDQLKAICHNRKFDVLTTEDNWREFKPLIMDLISAAPLTRLSNEELEHINHGQFDQIQFRIKAREVLHVAQIKRARVLGQEDKDD